MYRVVNKLGLLVASIAFFAGNALAEGFYFAGSGALFEFSDKDIRDDASLTSLVGRFGTEINENFSGEVRVGIGIGDDTVSIPPLGRADVDLESYYGAYLRGGLQANNVIYPYGVVGYNTFKVETSVPGLGSSSDSESDYAYGIGADVNLGSEVVLNFEYMNYFNKDRTDINGITLGLAKRF